MAGPAAGQKVKGAGRGMKVKEDGPSPGLSLTLLVSYCASKATAGGKGAWPTLRFFPHLPRPSRS